MKRRNPIAIAVIAVSLIAPSEVKLPAGARVLANAATALHQPGSVIAEVSDSLNGAIVHIK